MKFSLCLREEPFAFGHLFNVDNKQNTIFFLETFITLRSHLILFSLILVSFIDLSYLSIERYSTYVQLRVFVVSCLFDDRFTKRNKLMPLKRIKTYYKIEILSSDFKFNQSRFIFPYSEILSFLLTLPLPHPSHLPRILKS